MSKINKPGNDAINMQQIKQPSTFLRDLTNTRKCNGNHQLCNNIAKKFVNNIEDPELNQELFNVYLQFMSSSNGSYNCCTSTYNTGYSNILTFILNSSSKYIFPPQYFGLIINYMQDTNLLKLIQNQLNLDPDYINKLAVQENINTNSQSNANLLSCFFYAYSSKQQSLKFLLERIKVEHFVNSIPKFKNSLSNGNEHFIVEYIKNNVKELKLQKEKCIEIINTLPYRSLIFQELFKTISPCTSNEIVTDLINRAINNLDKNLILTILEGTKTLEPTENMVDSLLQRVYVSPGNKGADKNNIIAEIMDILIMFGLKVTKNIIIKLLNKTCYINEIEKYNVPIDEDILYICSNFSYYPYKFNIKPPISVLIKECSKHDNLDTIKKLKEYGGEYNIQCLIEACKNLKNGKVIKYLINDCGIKTNDTCVKTFQETYKIEALDSIIAGYDPNKNIEPKKTSQSIELDTNSTLVIEPKPVKYNKENNELEFKLNNKVKKFFDFKKKSIKYLEIYELMLKYLISKKLVIGSYFVINNDLASLLKLESCSIIHIDQLHSIISYLIDPL